MSDKDTLIFRDHDGVGGYPAHDGFVDLDMLEVTGEVPETGYIGGCQLNAANGTLPPVMFRGIRHGSGGRLMFGFLCRFNLDFHEDDAISIVLKPSFTSTDRTEWRKINIYPVGNGGALGGAPNPASEPLLIANNVRTNRDPRDSDYYEGSGTDAWTEIASGVPSEVKIKVRSWEHTDILGNVTDRAWSVEVELDPANVSGNWMNISDDFSLYFKVIKIISAGGGAATEYVFPLDAPPPAPGNLNDQFLDSFNPTKYGRGLKGGAIPAVADGISFENGWQGIGRRPLGSATTTLGSMIETGATGGGDGLDNEIVALIRNDGTSNATGISAEFRFANWGLGPLGFKEWDTPFGLAPNPTATANANAGASNVALVSEWPMADVPPEYQNSLHQCMWAQLNATSSVNFSQSSLRRNMNFHQLSSFENKAEVSGKGYTKPANGTEEHDFIIQTVSRTIMVRNLTENSKTVDPLALELARDTIIATGGLRPDNDDNDDRKDEKDEGQNRPKNIRDREKMAVKRRMAVARKTRKFTETVIHLWFTEGFRITNRTITINGTTYPILDNGCGSFGIAARHEGTKDPLSWRLHGTNLTKYGSQIYGLKVPHNGKTHIGIEWKSSASAPSGDQSDGIPRADGIPEQDWIGRPPGQNGGTGPGGDDPNTGSKPGDGDGKGKGKGGCLGLLIGLMAIPLGLLALFTGYHKV